MIVYFIGALGISILVKTLKMIINESRPTDKKKSSSGMPSSHATVLCFLSAYLALDIWNANSLAPFASIGLLLMTAAGSIVRVVVGYHTWAQVAVGAGEMSNTYSKIPFRSLKIGSRRRGQLPSKAYSHVAVPKPKPLFFPRHLHLSALGSLGGVGWHRFAKAIALPALDSVATQEVLNLLSVLILLSVSLRPKLILPVNRNRLLNSGSVGIWQGGFIFYQRDIFKKKSEADRAREQ